MTKTFLTIATTLLAFGIATPRVHADGATHNSFGGGIGIANPCNGMGVSATGPVDITFHSNENGHGVHVNIALQFKASGQDTAGNAYSTSFIANGQFDTASSSYEVPYHAVFIGQGSAPNFSYSGTVQVFVSGGIATGAHINTLTSSCTQ